MSWIQPCPAVREKVETRVNGWYVNVGWEDLVYGVYLGVGGFELQREVSWRSALAGSTSTAATWAVGECEEPP